MYYADPDGNQVELQVDNFETAEQGTAFMESESFMRNPVGVRSIPTSCSGECGRASPARCWWLRHGDREPG